MASGRLEVLNVSPWPEESEAGTSRRGHDGASEQRDGGAGGGGTASRCYKIQRFIWFLTLPEGVVAYARVLQ